MSPQVTQNPFELVLLGRGEILKGLALRLGMHRDRFKIVCLAAPPDVVETYRNAGLIGGDVLVLPSDARADEAIAQCASRLTNPLLISVQYPWILPQEVLRHFPDRAFNLHNAKLPDYRGHHALTHVILNEEPLHYSTIHWMQLKVDTGFLAYEIAIPVEKDETASSLGNKTGVAAQTILHLLIEDLAHGQPVPKTPIAQGGKFYSMKLADQLKRIDDEADLDRASLIARAFHYPPYEPAYFVREGRKYYVVPANDEESRG